MTAKQPLRDFLAERLKVDVGELGGEAAWAGAGNTIGGLALRTGLLTLKQIDRILSVQGTTEQLFGQIAIQLGYLTVEEVDRLVELQHFHADLEMGEVLFLAGRTDLASFIDAYGDYLAGK